MIPFGMGGRGQPQRNMEKETEEWMGEILIRDPSTPSSPPCLSSRSPIERQEETKQQRQKEKPTNKQTNETNEMDDDNKTL